MDKRLQQFLDAENISQAQLAETLGVARAGISHFLEAMATRFPQISMDWLLTGKGRMYKDTPAVPGENSLFAATQPPRRVSKILVFYDDNTFEEFQ